MKNLKSMAGWLALFLLAYVLIRVGVKIFPDPPIRWEILAVIGSFMSMIVIIFASVVDPGAAKATAVSFWFVLLSAGVYLLPISASFSPDLIEVWVIRAGLLFPVVMFFWNLTSHFSLVRKKEEEPAWSSLGVQLSVIIIFFLVTEKIILPMV